MILSKPSALVVAVVAVMLLAACGGGRGVSMPLVQPTHEENLEGENPPQNPPDTYQEDGEFEASRDYRIVEWQDPYTGEEFTFVIFDGSFCEWALWSGEVFSGDIFAVDMAVIGFKPDEWWIEEDYPIDDETPPWKLHEDAAIEELRSRGFEVWPYGLMQEFSDLEPPHPHWWSTRLPEGTTYFDIAEDLHVEFPCMKRVMPYLVVSWL